MSSIGLLTIPSQLFSDLFLTSISWRHLFPYWYSESKQDRTIKLPGPSTYISNLIGRHTLLVFRHFVLVTQNSYRATLVDDKTKSKLCGRDGLQWRRGGHSPLGKPLPIGNCIGSQFGRFQACLVMRSRFPKHIIQLYRSPINVSHWEYSCQLMNFARKCHL